MSSLDALRGLIGILAFLGLAWLLSEQRRSFPVRTLLWGLAGQVMTALILTRIPAVAAFFAGIARAVDGVQSASLAGASFVFGYLGGGALPFAPAAGGAGSSYIFAFQALPALLLVGALAALFWHWGVLIAIVRGAAWLFGHVFHVSGPVGVSTSACVFLGMVEAPLLVRPLLPRLSRGELFVIMVDGLSVIAGSMMIVLGTMLSTKLPQAFGHLLTASLISTPMAICMAKAIVPGAQRDKAARIELKSPYRGSLEALTQGTLDALKMALNIVALLLVFISIIALVNKGLALLPSGEIPLTLSFVMGKLLAPIAWLMGVAPGDLEQVGALLGTKLVANEVVAYGDLIALPDGALQPISVLIVTYALCSFGNIGSIAILIGSLSAVAPEKTSDVVQMGFKALAASFLTTCLTGTIIGLLHHLA
jgi:concentrative nucleoside transporter, CNT family